MNRTVENSLAVMSKEHEQTIVDEATTLITYIGFAETGVATSAAKWIIQKITSAAATSPTGVTTTKYATSYKYDKNVWDDRSSLTYVS